MRILPFIVSTIVTVGLVWALNKPWGDKVPMPLGKFLSPQHGFWQNAEDVNHNFSANLQFPDLKGKVDVYFDDRLVPHVFASEEDDLYFVQGYLHAKFRLFQMDLQTKVAEGRASEIAGEKAIPMDRESRRGGMRHAAENALAEMEKDPEAKAFYSAYTKGINAYINSLKESEIPVEYKILNFKPEPWTNLRTALLLKMMAKMLAWGTESDLAASNARNIFTDEQMKALYPEVQDSLLPIIPKGTVFDKPGIVPVKPAIADSVYFKTQKTIAAAENFKPDIDNGSNNWVVAGSKTRSGAPILANDPHLELSLPSIWYEMQLTTPRHNVYGVTLPGSPFIIIGFNDSIAWGVTNAQRDVKDFYEITFKDKQRKEYQYNGEWKPTRQVIEEIKIKGKPSVFDTVIYTHYGPVMFDESYTNGLSGDKNLAVRWVGYEPGNDGKAFHQLNHAENYNQYVLAISNMICPAQNFVFASKTGDIAIWQQGLFPARWEGQGLYTMPGKDSSFEWQGFIPKNENPHALNPARGFLESANQRPVDATYPYFIPGSYMTPRGIAIEHYLNNMTAITPQDMMALQNNYFNVTAQDIVPFFLKYVDESRLNESAKKYINELKGWDYFATAISKGQTIYQTWFDSLKVALWYDELNQVKIAAPVPDEQTTIEMLLRDSTTLSYINNINTPETETLADILVSSLNKAADNLSVKEKEGKLEWAAFKNPTVYHLLRTALMPFARTGLKVGGANNTINAIKHSHGPSWRMVAQMGAQTEAYGVYPGGQSGNPGSKFYDNFIDTWAKGEYYTLWVMKAADATDKKVKWTMNFSK
jgi:penicillin amidase